ncbi:MAG: hypothetical protein JRJ19_10140 [Deltaproteobacteria bacterium]|nr:hypothetical protein [Deltaproteobacteria bacterium]
MMRRVKYLILFSSWLRISVILTNCGPRASLRGLQELDEEYERLLRNWTQSGIIHRDLDRMLTVHATYLAPDFRQAFGVQYTKIFGIDPGKVDTDLELIATTTGQGHEFFMFTDITEDAWNNLDERDAVWRMALWGSPDQAGLPPASIHKFRGRGPNLKAFFPYIQGFGQSYLVTFPYKQENNEAVINPEHGSLMIKLASAFGTVKLHWKVQE